MDSLIDVLYKTTHTYPDRVAILYEDHKLTYFELIKEVSNLAQYLRMNGINPSDAVAFIFENNIASIVTFFALSWLKPLVIPIEPLSTSNDIENIYKRFPFKALLGVSQRLHQHQSVDHDLKWAVICTDNIQQSRTLSEFNPPRSISNNEIFLLHYTSGSTGKPKAAVHTQLNLIKGGYIYRETFNITEDDNILATVPLTHSFGMVAGLVTSMLSGAKLILLDRFVPRKIANILMQENVSVLVGVPLVYDLLVRSHIPIFTESSSLRLCLSSGAQLPKKVGEDFMEKYRVPIYQIYGTTETGVIAGQWPQRKEWPENSVGRPLKDVQVRITDEHNNDLPKNQIGSLLVRTSTMFTGYYGDVQTTSQKIREGWYVTGDFAKVDEWGNIYLQGRENTFINVGGKKVNPLEIEEVITNHPMVKEALVYGVDIGNKETGVKASVVLQGKVSIDELTAYCRSRLSSFKVPTYIEFTSSLPKTSLGKTIRRMDSDLDQEIY